MNHAPYPTDNPKGDAKPEPNRSRAERLARCGAAMAAVAALIAPAGCFVPELIGGMAQSYQRTGSSLIPAEYTGLQGKTWAVVVLADRGIRSELPSAIAVTTNATTRKLVTAQGTIDNPGPLGSAGYQSGPTVLILQQGNPAFEAWTYSEMAEKLAVDRLIVVDISRFRLYEQGNRYLWDGAVAARVGVLEHDRGDQDFAYVKDIAIRYPDQGGYTTEELSKAHITNTLLDRLTNRIAWLFYEHEEPNDISY